MTWMRAKAKDLLNLYQPFPFSRFALRYRCIFIHIPKTGGTSILRALNGNRYRRHLPWRTYQEANRFRFHHYHKFAVVRNPFDRLVSVYSYLKDGGSPVSDGELAQRIRTEAPTFKHFVMDFLSPHDLFMHVLFMPQAFFVCDDRGRVVLDTTCRFETLADDTRDVFQKLGVKKTQLQWTNRSTRKRDWRSYYDPDTTRRAVELYQVDFAHLGYSRDAGADEPGSTDG